MRFFAISRPMLRYLWTRDVLGSFFFFGSYLLSCFAGDWYEAEVIGLYIDRTIQIQYSGWGEYATNPTTA